MTQPIDDPPLSYALGRLGRQIRHAMDGSQIPGLTGPQVVALLTLKHEPGLSNAQLARRCFVTAQAMSEVVLDLERKDLLVRAPDPRNQRILRAQLTNGGRAIIVEIEARISRIEALMLDGFTPAEARAFRGAVLKAARNLGLPPKTEPAAEDAAIAPGRA